MSSFRTKKRRSSSYPRQPQPNCRTRFWFTKCRKADIKKKTISSVELTVEKLNDGKLYIVRSGLSAGDVIVTEGAGLLRDGMRINIKEE